MIRVLEIRSMEDGMAVFRFVQAALAVALVLATPTLVSAGRPRPTGTTVEALLALDIRPFAIGHRGSGENHPSRPVENTVESVRAAFQAGLSVVEIDVQLTRDGHLVAYHDDVLADFTCINALTLREVQAGLPYVPTLEAILEEARRFNRPGPALQGLVIIELKAARPLCDPGDHQDRPTVGAAARVVRDMRMTDQVLFTSFSPAILRLAQWHAPEIARILAVSGLQFLGQAEIEERFDTTVTVIEKEHGLGLTWAEIGTIFRLPGYRSPEELLGTALAVEARVVELDYFLLEASGEALVPALHALGLEVLGFTVDHTRQWKFLESLDVDGIYTNDIRLGLKRQARFPGSADTRRDERLSRARRR
jgi:glycerophosphoryl diester phosphodiesterase